METRIKETSKGFVATLAWSDGTKINSRAFPTSVEAQDWLLDQVLAQKGLTYRDVKPAQRIIAALAAVAILLPMALPVSAQYTPPKNPPPTTTTSTGTR